MVWLTNICDMPTVNMLQRNAQIAPRQMRFLRTIEVEPGWEDVITPKALAFVADLVRTFRGEIEDRLAARSHARLDFLPETIAIRNADWKVAPLPDELLDRRVEITGPTDRKMIINALSS